MDVHHLFIVDLECPLKKIIEVDCSISIGPKRTWAFLPNGKKRLLGSSAFYTRPAAVRTKLVKLQRIKDTPFLMRNPTTAQMYQAACWQLEAYNKTGILH